MTNDTERQTFVLPPTFYIHYNDIDPQHEGLIDIVNACVAQLVDGVLEDFEAPFNIFVDRLTAHFRHEEDLMRDLGYSGLEWHAEHHAECLKRVESLIADMRAQGYAGLHDLRVCFHDIIHDVVHADLKFGEFLDGLGLIPRRQ